MKIEVGEYIRTKEGEIGRIVDIDEISLLGDEHLFETEYSEGFFELSSYDIKSHSKDIIDLIEVRRLCEWRKSYRYYGSRIIYRKT